MDPGEPLQRGVRDRAFVGAERGAAAARGEIAEERVHGESVAAGDDAARGAVARGPRRKRRG